MFNIQFFRELVHKKQSKILYLMYIMQYLALIIVFGCVFYMTYFNNHKEHKITYFTMLSLFILGILYFVRIGTIRIEGMTSDEAIQNVASIYNTDNMVVKNLQVTGNLTAGGITTSTITVGSNLTCNGNTNTKTINVSDLATVNNTLRTKTIQTSGDIVSTNGNVIGTIYTRPVGKSGCGLYAFTATNPNGQDCYGNGTCYSDCKFAFGNYVDYGTAAGGNSGVASSWKAVTVQA